LHHLDGVLYGGASLQAIGVSHGANGDHLEVQWPGSPLIKPEFFLAKVVALLQGGIV
jgi:hypothetical protein